MGLQALGVFMGEFSLVHWLVIAVVGIVFFGPKRLPALGQSLGESIRGFKKALNDHHDDVARDEAPRRESLQATNADQTKTTTSSKDTTRS
jgi:sec-independent protein translocase protein TatA